MAAAINFSVGVGVFIAFQHQFHSKICTKGLYYHLFSKTKQKKLFYTSLKKTLFMNLEFISINSQLNISHEAKENKGEVLHKAEW